MCFGSFFVPYGSFLVVTGTLWAWMYDPSSGVINTILREIDKYRKFRLIADPKIAIYCMILSAFGNT